MQSFFYHDKPHGMERLTQKDKPHGMERLRMDFSLYFAYWRQSRACRIRGRKKNRRV
jgi:hypothetical protein